jgi:hypothetical protein
MRYRIVNARGDVLCTYKAHPEATLPTVGFIGADSLALVEAMNPAPAHGMRALEYGTRNGANAAGHMYGGAVVPVPDLPPVIAQEIARCAS